MLLIRQAENTSTGQAPFKERSPVNSRFSELLFLDVPGTAAEQVLTCGFRKNSSNLDKTLKMRDSILLNSWDSFLATPPSISSESCVIYSWLILGTDVFRDWAVPRMFHLCFSCNDCQFSFFPRLCF